MIIQRLILYAQLVRLDKPIGSLLLLWPTLCALWLASAGQPDWPLVAIFSVGTVLMRSAGCAINDFADRDFDRHVKRTAERPLTAGKIRSWEALMVAAVLALVSAVNRPQLRINLDLYHTQIGEGDLIRWCQACLPWIGEVQVADNPGRCEPGTGEINYHGVANALKNMGYAGPVGLESFAKGDEEAALTAFRTAFTV